jgi:hypothetical protein
MRILLYFIMLLLTCELKAQSSCNDPAACNYDPMGSSDTSNCNYYSSDINCDLVVDHRDTVYFVLFANCVVDPSDPIMAKLDLNLDNVISAGDLLSHINLYGNIYE